MPQQRVELNYFKPSGKWYGHGTFFVKSSMAIYQIVERVREKSRQGILPGLCLSNTPFEYYIVVTAPGHSSEYPALITTEVEHNDN